jgi:hypothetical protein
VARPSLGAGGAVLLAVAEGGVDADELVDCGNVEKGGLGVEWLKLRRAYHQ